MKILAVVPAKGTSSRLPNKNIRDLHGRPLVSYVIGKAVSCAEFAKVIVSTDDVAIKEVALRHNAEVPFLRPKSLCQATTRVVHVLIHLLDQLEQSGEHFTAVAVLQPTSPLISVGDIKQAVRVFKEKNGCKPVMSVTEYDFPPQQGVLIDGGKLLPIFDEKYLNRLTQSQLVPKAYHPNGAINITDVKLLRKHESFYTDQTAPYIMPRLRSVDIDDEVDFEFAEFLLNKYTSAKISNYENS